MVLPTVLIPSILVEDGDGMADNYISISRFIGSTTTTAGEVNIGVQDGDTVTYLDGTATLTEGNVLSVHAQGGADYQNTSGFDAVAVVTLLAINAGTQRRHVKVYAHTLADTAAGTLLWEVNNNDITFFDASGDFLTSPPLKIPTGNYINVENVDDSEAGLNDVKVGGAVGSSTIVSLVVERQE